MSLILRIVLAVILAAVLPWAAAFLVFYIYLRATHG